MDDAVRRKELVPLKDFLDSKNSIYAKSWVPTPWQVFSWGLKQLGVMGGESAEDRLVAGNFVVMANVEVRLCLSTLFVRRILTPLQAAAKAVLDEASRTVTSNTSRIFSQELFSTTFSSAIGVDTLSNNDLSVLLTHLARDRSAIAYSLQSRTIKFKVATEPEPPTLTPEDVNIASIRTLLSSLEPQIQQLMARVSELEKTAKEAVASKNLTTAKSALRQKKLADTKLQQRTATLSQLEEVYAKIEQAADQVEMVRVMEASSQTLKSLNKQTGGVEKVQDVMEGLRDEMMNVDEIGLAINDVNAGEIDEGEVEDELEALEKVEREKREVAERKEREAREAKEAEEKRKADEAEAEKTRQRLAELDQVGEDMDSVASGAPTNEAAQERKAMLEKTS